MQKNPPGASGAMKLLAALVASSGDAIIAKTLDGTIMAWNPGAERLYGYSSVEMVGRSIKSIIPAELHGEFECIMSRLAAGEQIEHHETERIRKDGERITISVTISPVYDKDGAILGASAIAHDVTAQRRSELALRESEAQVRLLLDSTAEGIYTLDANGVCTLCNRAGARMLGYERAQELIGMPMHSLAHHTRADGTPFPEAECVITRVARTGESFHESSDILWRRDGTSFPVEYWAYPIITGDTLCGSVVTFVDITERRALEARIRQGQKMEALGALAGGIAHDFNNLLTVISSYTDFVIESLNAADPRTQDLREVRKASASAARLTRQLLAFSRKEVARPQLISLEDSVKSTLPLLRRVIGDDIEVVTSLRTQPSVVYIDPVQLEQVIMNLAINARDAMPAGGTITVEASVATFEDAVATELGLAMKGSYAVLSVSDSGEGMDEATKTRIFEPFFTTKEPGKGTGLGLATVYGIVQQHDGFVRVLSEPGRGSTFEVCLPLHLYSASESAEEMREAMPSGSEVILLVEDSAAVRAAAKAGLERCGYTVIDVSDGQMALALLEHADLFPALLVTDVVMPKMSGRELADAVTNLRPATRVLYMSGYPDDALLRRGVARGKASYLPKPFTPAALSRKVREVLDS